MVALGILLVHLESSDWNWQTEWSGLLAEALLAVGQSLIFSWTGNEGISSGFVPIPRGLSLREILKERAHSLLDFGAGVFLTGIDSMGERWGTYCSKVW